MGDFLAATESIQYDHAVRLASERKATEHAYHQQQKPPQQADATETQSEVGAYPTDETDAYS
jgi:hypothetical protein